MEGRLALSYGVECWTMSKRERGKELVVKVYMLRWTCELQGGWSCKCMHRRKPNTSFNKRKWMFDIFFSFSPFPPLYFYHNEILIVIIKKAIWECT